MQGTSLCESRGWVFVYHQDSASSTMGFQGLSLVGPRLLEKKGRG